MWSVGLAHTWLANCGGTHEADERDIWGAARLQGDWVHPEVLQHVEDGLEPEVLHSTLTVLIQGQTEVLKGRELGRLRTQWSKVKVNIQQKSLFFPLSLIWKHFVSYNHKSNAKHFPLRNQDWSRVRKCWKVIKLKEPFDRWNKASTLKSNIFQLQSAIYLELRQLVK